MDAVIFDVDGTLCDVSEIRWMVAEDSPNRDFHQFHIASTASPVVPFTEWLWGWAGRMGYARIVVTARQARYFQHTLWWLLLNGFEPDDMYMRGWNDCRPDSIVKEEILDVIRQRWNPVLAIDDNPSVIAVWERHNIPTVTIPGWD